MIDDSSVVIGDVRLADDVGIWPLVVIRVKKQTTWVSQYLLSLILTLIQMVSTTLSLVMMMQSVRLNYI